MEEIEVQEVKTLSQKIKETPASYYLAAIMVIVFAILHVLNIVGQENYVISNFAKNTYSIAIDNQFYRLFTPIFIHEGITHLFFNIMALVYLAKPIEAIFGKSKFVIIFLVAGLFGTLASFIFSSGLAIGASGGVFGIFGVHFYLFLKNKEQYMKIFGKNMLELLVLNVVIGFIIPNIDYWGHFGGILGGFLAATTLGLSSRYVFNKKSFGMGLITVIIFFSSFNYFNNNFEVYNNNVNNLLINFNNSYENQDEDAFLALRDDIEKIRESKPFLPPHPGADNMIDEIEKIYIQFDL